MLAGNGRCHHCIIATISRNLIKGKITFQTLSLPVLPIGIVTSNCTRLLKPSFWLNWLNIRRDARYALHLPLYGSFHNLQLWRRTRPLLASIAFWLDYLKGGGMHEAGSILYASLVNHTYEFLSVIHHQRTLDSSHRLVRSASYEGHYGNSCR
jgi:hypothetical protein